MNDKIKKKVLEYITRYNIYKALVESTHKDYGFNRWARFPGEGVYTMENVAADLAKRNTLSFNFTSWHCPIDENGFAIWDCGDGTIGCSNKSLDGIKIDEYNKLSTKKEYRSIYGDAYPYVASPDNETSFIIDGNYDIHVSALWPYSASSGNPPNNMEYADLSYLKRWHGKHTKDWCLGCKIFGNNTSFC